MQPRTTYIIDRVLHWTGTFSILLLLFEMGSRIHNVDYRLKGVSTHKQDAIELHMIFAIIMIVALVARLVWSRFYLATEYKTTFDSKKHKLLVNVVHFAMYLVLFLLCLSGILMVINYEHAVNLLGLINFSEGEVSKYIFNRSNDWHLILESVIYGLIFVHFAGAIYNRR